MRNIRYSAAAWGSMILLWNLGLAFAQSNDNPCGSGPCPADHMRLELAPVFAGPGFQYGTRTRESGLGAGVLQLGTRFHVSTQSALGRTFYRLVVLIGGNAAGGSPLGFTGGADGQFEAQFGGLVGTSARPVQFAVYGGIDGAGSTNGGPGAVLSQYALFGRIGAGVRVRGQPGWYLTLAPTAAFGTYQSERPDRGVGSAGVWVGGDVSLDHPRISTRARLLHQVSGQTDVARAAGASLISVEFIVPVATVGQVLCDGTRESRPTPDFHNMTVSVSGRGDVGVQVDADRGSQVQGAGFVHVNIHWLNWLIRNSRPAHCGAWH